MKYLVRVVETLRVASEDEAQKVIEQAKKDRNFALGKYSSEYKCKKVKGEIVEDWYRVTLVKDFTDEKEPDCTTEVSYNVTQYAAAANENDTEEDVESAF